MQKSPDFIEVKFQLVLAVLNTVTARALFQVILLEIQSLKSESQAHAVLVFLQVPALAFLAQKLVPAPVHPVLAVMQARVTLL